MCGDAWNCKIMYSIKKQILVKKLWENLWGSVAPKDAENAEAFLESKSNVSFSVLEQIVKYKKMRATAVTSSAVLAVSAVIAAGISPSPSHAKKLLLVLLLLLLLCSFCSQKLLLVLFLLFLLFSFVLKNYGWCCYCCSCSSPFVLKNCWLMLLMLLLLLLLFLLVAFIIARAKRVFLSKYKYSNVTWLNR